MGSQSRGVLLLLKILILLCLSLPLGCKQSDSRRTVTLWHQMVPRDRVMLDQLVAEFEAAHPEINVRTLYKETEELRSGFQTATLAGIGPELIYGPSDVLGTFHAMGIVGDMSPWIDPEVADEFVEGALYVSPRFTQPSSPIACPSPRPIWQSPCPGLQPQSDCRSTGDDR